MSKLKPQLAVDTVDGPQRFPLWGFRKIDGVRGCHLTGAFTGRSLEAMKNLTLAEKFSHPGYAGFDGELTLNGYLRDCDVPDELRPDGNETLCGLTTGITGRSKLRKGETEFPTNVVWNLFDFLTPDTIDMAYEDRYANLRELIGYGEDASIRLLPYTVINDAEEMQAFIEESLELGYEGAIFRDPKAKHKSGRATVKGNDFWRFKPTSDKDFRITGFVESLENQNEAKVNALGHTERSSSKAGMVGKGTLGKFLGVDLESGQDITVPAGALTHKQRQYIWDHKAEFLGRYAKYTSLDTGVKDAPRQGRFKEFREKFDLAAKEAA